MWTSRGNVPFVPNSKSDGGEKVATVVVEATVATL
jgi:hypothetical protein